MLLAIAFTVALLAPTLTLADITGQASGLLAETGISGGAGFPCFRIRY